VHQFFNLRAQYTNVGRTKRCPQLSGYTMITAAKILDAARVSAAARNAKAADMHTYTVAHTPRRTQ
jgi:hypothetical protein